MIKAIVFDFDGLIIDTEYALYESLCDLLNVQPNQEIPIKEYASYIGSDSTDLFNYVWDKSNGLLTKKDLIDKSKLLHEEKLRNPVAREGVKSYLQQAKDQGMKIGLASSSYLDWVEHFLTELDIIHYFDAIQTRDHVEKVKPDPALYRNVVELLGVEPSEAIAFEDSGNGSKAAIAAGLHCVIVPNRITEHLLFEKYHARLTSMEEKKLSDVIEAIEAV